MVAARAMKREVEVGREDTKQVEEADQGALPLTLSPPMALYLQVRPYSLRLEPDETGRPWRSGTGSRGNSHGGSSVLDTGAHYWVRFNPEPRNHRNIAHFSPLIMSDNPSFVLRGIYDVIFDERPIPDSASVP